MPPPYPLDKSAKDALYAATIAGIAGSPGDYPSGPGQIFETTVLSARVTAKISAANDRRQKVAAARLAVTAEKVAYDLCDQEERRILRLAEALYAQAAPGKLARIGWGPRKDREKREPGQPRALIVAIQDQMSLTLKWRGPLTGSGGRVAFYRIEREITTLDGLITEAFGTWSTQSVQASLELTGLTRGVEYSFRVVAVNASGSSEASNTVSAVL